MKYQVIHETTYRYESPVAISQQLLHLTPRALPWQKREQHLLSIDPAPAEKSEREDYFGNAVTQILLAAPHESLRVRSESTVSVEARPAPPAGEAWEKVRDASRSDVEPAQYLYESPHVEIFR